MATSGSLKPIRLPACVCILFAVVDGVGRVPGRIKYKLGMLCTNASTTKLLGT